MTHAIYIAIMALVAQGAYSALREGMILSWLGRVFEMLPTSIQKPLHTCPVCMVSAWGIPAVLYTAEFGGMGFNPAMLPVYLLASAGVNWITPS